MRYTVPRDDDPRLQSPLLFSGEPKRVVEGADDGAADGVPDRLGIEVVAIDSGPERIPEVGGGAEARVEGAANWCSKSLSDWTWVVLYMGARNGLGLLHSASRWSRSHMISQKNTHMKLCRSS